MNDTVELTAVQFIVDDSMHNIENKNLSTELSILPSNHFVDDADVEHGGGCSDLFPHRDACGHQNSKFVVK